MKNSVVYIKSAINHSFGSGFVIHQDEEGCFILTCQHVVDEVGTPLVENQTVEVIATSSNTIDMAVLYVNELKLEPLPLQIDNCNSADVEVIGFSQFTKSLNQKEYIHATLFENPIELLSKDSGFSYNARKIKAKEGV
ncbi:MAG: serine protease [Epsilonproteobacteria bacterium]|nr:serine protease [Campylobacterota bacterium]